MYNMLFPSGRVLEFGTVEIAMIYVSAYNATLLPNIVVDNDSEVRYNASVVNDMEVI